MEKEAQWEDGKTNEGGSTASRAQSGWDKTTRLGALALTGSTGSHWFVLKVKISLQKILGTYFLLYWLKRLMAFLNIFPGL